LNAQLPRVELYGSITCPYTAELREHLEWQREVFVEYDVEADPLALGRLQQLTGGNRAVPVLVENGVVRTVGWLGRSCLVGAPKTDHA
jgi:mycoredoxin